MESQTFMSQPFSPSEICASSVRTITPAMLSHPLSTLSAELIDEIVDWVALLGTKVDLRSLLATDRAFGERCRVRLFTTLALIVEYPEALEACWRMIQEHPPIIRYIRELQLQGIGSQITMERDIWSGAEPSFDNIIQAVSTSPQPPTSLQLSGRIEIPASFDRWTANSFFSTTLTNLDLNHVANFPLTTIRHLRNLSFLNIYWVGVEEEPLTPLQTARKQPPPKLESLTYRMAHRAVRLLVEASQPDSQYAVFNNLRVLHAQTKTRPDMASLQFLIGQSSSSLEELEIRHYHPYLRSMPRFFCSLTCVNKLNEP
jgi:hypothetical protein